MCSTRLCLKKGVSWVVCTKKSVFSRSHVGFFVPSGDPHVGFGANSPEKRAPYRFLFPKQWTHVGFLCKFTEKRASCRFLCANRCTSPRICSSNDPKSFFFNSVKHKTISESYKSSAARNTCSVVAGHVDWHSEVPTCSSWRFPLVRESKAHHVDFVFANRRNVEHVFFLFSLSTTNRFSLTTMKSWAPPCFCF